MKEQLLLEGAVAGHMNHIYDNGEMTFGELKQLLQAVADGKVRGTEKTDGQNIFLSFNVRTQKAKAIRNKGHIKAGGLDTQAFDEFFADHPAQALRFSFVDALQAFEEAIKQVDKDTQEKIFGRNNEVYFNTEVMNPGTPGLEDGDPRGKGTTNVIPYDKKTLLIHRVGHGAFDVKTGQKLEQDVTQNFDILEQAIAGMSTEDPAIFSVETNAIRRLSPLKDKEILNTTISELDNLLRDQGLADDATINDYVISQVKPEIDALGLTEDRNEMILKRVMGMPGKPNLRQITTGLPQEIKDDVSNFVKGFKYASYTTYMQNLLHNFSVQAVNGLESAFISDNQKQIKFLQDEIRDTVKRIEGSSNERAKEELARQMKKLKSAEGINTPSEGFVFSWNGVTYKLTGNFAPANQILGMERFQRFGPIEPKENEEKALEGETKPLTIGVVPGAFKPPHKGHLSMVEALAENADKVIVIVSTPTKGGRALPSGKVIDSDDAVQIWNAYLDASPAGKKTTVIKSPSASPVGVTYDFVMKQPDPTDLLVAPPNATVLLGCGDKEDDQTRFETIAAKARKDLKIKIQVCELTAKHSPEYLQMLNQHPAILENLPSNRKSSVSVEDLHASDMRYVIDVASREPIGVSMLQDFVPMAEDALAVMGILGLNPADAQSSESDQVSEPEIDRLSEIILEEAKKVFEGFKAQRAPIAKKSSGNFQRNMKNRLAKAHSTYLDMGRKDLIKHGVPFSSPRIKDKSNAFLAEEDIDEGSFVGAPPGGGGSIEGAPFKSANKKDIKKMKDQENRLRSKIRKGLKEFFKQNNNKHSESVASILEEHALRLKLREVILEQSLISEIEDPTTDVHDNTGINTLKDLFKNTNILSTLRNVYKTLTTDEDQKNSFRAHIVQWTKDTLAPVKLNDTDALTEQQVGVDIQGIEAEKFIDAKDGSEKEDQSEPEEEEVMKPISGEDTTGRNKAERVYPTIEKSIVDYYAELDNPEDQEMFYDYLIANLKLYFDKWDNESAKSIEEPTNDAYSQAKDAETAPGLSAS
jgi:cytidyltransferase-like protein